MGKKIYDLLSKLRVTMATLPMPENLIINCPDLAFIDIARQSGMQALTTRHGQQFGGGMRCISASTCGRWKYTGFQVLAGGVIGG